jgi:hypothetical protein
LPQEKQRTGIIILMSERKSRLKDAVNNVAGNLQKSFNHGEVSGLLGGTK